VQATPLWMREKAAELTFQTQHNKKAMIMMPRQSSSLEVEV